MVYICMPTKGLNYEQYMEQFRKNREIVKQLYPDEICPLLFPEEAHITVIHDDIYQMGCRLRVMAECDKVFLAKEWYTDKASVREKEIAHYFGLKIINVWSNHLLRQ